MAEEQVQNGRITKNFPVFDCDGHVNDPHAIWEDYVPDSEKELVRETYWVEGRVAILNGTSVTFAPSNSENFAPMYNAVTIAGPQMNKKIMRRLQAAPLTREQREYLDHKGAVDPHARVADMDLMGIDQALVLPTSILSKFPWASNPDGAAAFARAYNNWARDWCDNVPSRLYPAGILPLQSARLAVAELERIAEMGFPVALVRPFDARGRYPNDIGSSLSVSLGRQVGTLDAVYRAFEDTGVCLGMHTFPAVLFGRTGRQLVSPGEMLTFADTDSQTMSFVFEAQTWLGQVLLSGFLDRYPRLKMLIFESNSQWLPYLLETCDRLAKLYANERSVPLKRLPSEAFVEQCMISFESDEDPTFEQWDVFGPIGIWSSDAYHHDGADAWSSIRRMRALGVPEDVQAGLMGGNAQRIYGIEPKLFVTEEPDPIKRPDWFPQGPELDEWADLVAHPRKNKERLRAMGLENPLVRMVEQAAHNPD